jgi:hypothetical protein
MRAAYHRALRWPVFVIGRRRPGSDYLKARHLHGSC